MLYILNRDMEIVTVANNIGTSLPYFEDLHVQNLEAGTSSYEFTIPTNHPDADQVVEGNFVVRTDLDGNHLMFTIMTMEESHSNDSLKVVYCEDAGMELLNEVDVIYKETTAKNIQYYINKAINTPATGWTIGYCDVTATRTLEFTEYDNVLARILKIASEFDAEISFSVQLTGTKVSKRLVNIHKQRGENNGKRFTYSKDITSIKRKVDMSEVATALLVVGKADDKGVTAKITALSSDDGDIYTVNGSEYLYSRSALDRWGQVGGNIHKVFQYETSSTSELLNRAISDLKKRINPAVTYEAEVALLERLAGYEEEAVRIGDTVKVIDTTFTPALYLEARIVALETSYTDPSKDKATLGNYKVVKSNISAQLLALQSKLLQKEATWDTVGDIIFKDLLPPASPAVNDLWMDISVTPNILKRWTGSAWVNASPTSASQIGAEISISKVSTAPASPVVNQMWLDTSMTPNQLKRWSGSAWVNATPTTATDIGAETTIYKQTTAPTHLAGRMWLDTSVTPNILKRSTGSAWVNATPTTPSEVGAESSIYKQSTAPTHLVGRLWLDTSVSPNIMKRSDGTNWINLSPTQASHIGAYSTSEADSKFDFTSWYASAKANGNMIKSILDMTLPTTYAWLDNVTLPDGTKGRVVQKKFLANSVVNNNGWLMDWIVVDPRKTYMLEFWVQARDVNSIYYYGREEATDAGVANDAGNGPYIVSGRRPLAGDVGVWKKHFALIPPHYAGAELSHTTDQSSFTPDIEYKFWDANTAQIQIKTYLTYQPTATLDSEMYATGFGLYEVGSADGLYDSIASLDSKIEAKTDPTKIIETVIYAESFTSILSDKASVEDISDMATGTQVTGVKDTVTKYIDGRLDDEGGINDKINIVSASLTKTANDISAKFTSMGGINLIRNSIGYAGTDIWTISGTMNTLQNQELEQLGFGSGFYSVVGTGGYIEQTIPTHVGQKYSLSFWLKKSVGNATNGDAGVEVYENGVKKSFIGKTTTVLTSGYELGIYTFDTQYSEVTIRVTVGANAEAIISGLMLNTGEDALQWQHANGEIYNTNVQMNMNGIKVINGQTQGYTIMSPQEFSGYGLVEGTMQRVFTLNGDTTEVTKIDIDKEINMSPVKVIPIVSTNINGWAWIPSD